MSEIRLEKLEELTRDSVASDKMAMVVTEGGGSAADNAEFLGVINTAIATDPAATRDAAEVDSALKTAARFGVQLDARTVAYASRVQSTDLVAMQRLDEFIRGLDNLGLTMVEGVFLGEGMNTGTSLPRAFLSLAEATNTTAQTYDEATHGYSIAATTDDLLFIHDITLPDDFVAIYFGSGDDTVTANRNLFSLSHESDPTAIRIGTTDTSGSVRSIADKIGLSRGTGPNFASGFGTETPKQIALMVEEAVEYKTSVDGAAWVLSQTTTRPYSGLLTELQLGQHKHTVQAGVVISGLMTDAEINSVYDLAKRTIYSSDIRLVGEGDSLMNGSDEWVEMALKSGSWAGAATSFANIAADSETAKDVYDQAVAGSFDTYSPTAAIPRTWLILQAGTNDFGQADSGDFTNANILFHLTETCRIAKEAGFEKTILCTTLLRLVRQSDIVDHNLLLTNGTALGLEHVDLVLDLDGAMAAVAGADYYENATYFSDGVHPNDTGRQVLADKMNASAKPIRGLESTF